MVVNRQIAAINGDPLVDNMKVSKDVAAVLKMELVTLRGRAPNCVIFAFEGDDDKGAYYQWVRAIDQSLDFEPFPCGGKGKVLELRKVVMRDKNNLADNIFYFIDRDFDDFRDQTPDDTIFMTDRYSIENYLVNESVLIEVLKNNFHCHAQPDVRTEVVRLFHQAYSAFLKASTPLNYRFFIARKAKISILEKPLRIGHIATISLNDATACARHISEILVLEREPTEQETEELKTEFDNLEPETRFRGKFALLFFLKWLAIVADERRVARAPLFDKLDSGVKIRHEALTIELLASKSGFPPALPEFIAGVRKRLAA